MCNHCGCLLAPSAEFCHSCGFPIAAMPTFAITAPSGTQKALIGTTPLWQVVGGFFFIIIGLVAFSANSFFAPIAAIIVLMGIVFLVLGLLGKPIYSQQVVYQQTPTTGDYRSGATKQCPQCGTQLMAAALACYKCGASV